MTTLANELAAWLADYYLLATVLLAAAIAAGFLVREPVKRISLAWGTTAGLLILAVLCAAPFWPRIALVHAPANPLTVSQPILSPTTHDDKLNNQAAEPTVDPLSTITPSNNFPAVPLTTNESHQKIEPAEKASAPINLVPLFTAAFALGALAMLAWLTIGALQARRLRRTGSPAPMFVHEELAAIVAHFSGCRLRTLPGLLLSAITRTAAALGLIRPTILIPTSAIETDAHSLSPSPTLRFTPSPLHPLARSSPPRSPRSRIRPHRAPRPLAAGPLPPAAHRSLSSSALLVAAPPHPC
jgi:hypothetical protein